MYPGVTVGLYLQPFPFPLSLTCFLQNKVSPSLCLQLFYGRVRPRRSVLQHISFSADCNMQGGCGGWQGLVARCGKVEKDLFCDNFARAIFRFPLCWQFHLGSSQLAVQANCHIAARHIAVACSPPDETIIAMHFCVKIFQFMNRNFSLTS